MDTTRTGNVLNGSLAYVLNRGFNLENFYFNAINAGSLSTTKLGAQNVALTLGEFKMFLNECNQ